MIILKSIIIYFIAALVFLLIGPIVLLIIFICPSIAYKLIIYWCNFMVYIFGCKTIAKGQFPDNQTYVVMANHVSFLDVFAIPSVFKGKFSAVAASKNFKIPVYSIFLKKLKVISIDRANRIQSIQGIKQAETLLKEGYHITILPEGTRTTTGELGDFKKGGFHLAVNTKTSILPIVTKGLYDIKPVNRFSIKPGTIHIKVGDPIPPENKTVDELLEETKTVFQNMINNY